MLGAPSDDSGNLSGGGGASGDPSQTGTPASTLATNPSVLSNHHLTGLVGNGSDRPDGNSAPAATTQNTALENATSLVDQTNGVADAQGGAFSSLANLRGSQTQAGSGGSAAGNFGPLSGALGSAGGMGASTSFAALGGPRTGVATGNFQASSGANVSPQFDLSGSGFTAQFSPSGVSPMGEAGSGGMPGFVGVTDPLFHNVTTGSLTPFFNLAGGNFSRLRPWHALQSQPPARWLD